LRIVHIVIVAYRLLVYFLTRTRVGRALVFLSIPIALLAVALWKPNYEPPIFDAQVHYDQEAWSRISVEAIMNTAEELNVPWLLVGSIPNEGTWRLYSKDTNRVIPMLVPAFSREQRDNWHMDSQMLDYIKAELEQRPYRGLGELFLYSEQTETPVAKAVLQLAAKHRLVLHTRSDQKAISNIFTQQPTLRVLWAHAGIDVRPEQVSQLLNYYPRLWVEISHRRSVAPGGKLDPKWRALMLRHPDRVLLGSGTYNSDYWHKFRTYMSEYRNWLKELPPNVAERIAYRNGLRLFEIQNEASRKE
jgi:predicted TIM-barrel fold metal-dependent hydrolase